MIEDDLSGAGVRIREATEADLVDGLQPRWVASPSTTEETATLMEIAGRNGLAVVPRGAGTKISWGKPPTRVDLVIDMTGMNRVLEHVAGDLVVVVESGLRLDDLQAVLAKTGQRLALDETVPGSTIGGIVATAASGCRRMASGTVRDLLIGITVVRADGVVASAGGKVVKNVAGYDLGKLFTGSFGTLGVITRAVFKLHPMPKASRWVVAQVDESGGVRAAVESVLHSQIVPSALEVDWPADGRSGAVGVLIEGTPTGVEVRAGAAATLMGDRARVEENAGVWRTTYPWSPGEYCLKLTCELSSVPDLLVVAAEHGVHVRGSAGVGVLYGAMGGDVDIDRAAWAIGSLRGFCSAHGGSVVVMDAPRGAKGGLDVWGPVNGLDLMRKVKEQFDRRNTLSPGRFVGGI